MGLGIMGLGIMGLGIRDYVKGDEKDTRIKQYLHAYSHAWFVQEK